MSDNQEHFEPDLVEYFGMSDVITPTNISVLSSCSLSCCSCLICIIVLGIMAKILFS